MEVVSANLRTSLDTMDEREREREREREKGAESNARQSDRGKGGIVEGEKQERKRHRKACCAPTLCTSLDAMQIYGAMGVGTGCVCFG